MAAELVEVDLDGPTVRPGAEHTQDRRAGEQRGPMPDSTRKVIRIERALRADVAAGDAVAAVGARAALDALGVRRRVGDGERHTLEAGDPSA